MLNESKILKRIGLQGLIVKTAAECRMAQMAYRGHRTLERLEAQNVKEATLDLYLNMLQELDNQEPDKGKEQGK